MRVLILLIAVLIASCSAATCASGENVCNVILRSGKADKQCYNPITHSCIENLVCPKGTDARCGDSCFSSHPTTGFVCFEDFFLCGAGFPNICGTTCYDHTQFICNNGVLKQI